MYANVGNSTDARLRDGLFTTCNWNRIGPAVLMKSWGSKYLEFLAAGVVFYSCSDAFAARHKELRCKC